MQYKSTFLAVLLFCSQSGYAQFNNNSPSQSSLNKNIIFQKPGHFYTTYVYKDGKAKTNDIDMTEMLNLIVEFKGEPLFIKSKVENKAIEKAAYQNIFLKFAGDLNTMYQSSSRMLKVTLNAPEITCEYYKIFFGASVTVPRALRDRIASLNYVEKIFKDEDVKAVSEPVNETGLVRSIKKLSGSTGKGIVVGIIDTGIDYLHPALGGGFGPRFKVIGGYDFVNKDNDPMDDNGHGTHVAGIIAAKSDSVTGIAPDASLMAFKVLNQYGSGTMSTVLEGIERAVDPNNDGNPSDKVDIANMSLGSSGNPDDPLATAVDNASELGVTFCIAAGNSGNYNQIGSPGVAATAITVGASDEQDHVAVFSSRGPDRGNYSIKPEVLAPGVNIKSTYLNNSFERLSGTSMATPYITGVCALIKSLHPDWSPAMIKSAVVNTASDVGADVMSEGAGEVNLQKSETESTLAIPSTLSFGLDDARLSNWSRTDTIDIINEDTTSQNYTLSITGLQAGINITAEPSGFNLPAGGNQKVIFTLTVDNSNTNYIDTLSRSYMGSVLVSGEPGNIHLPWAFVKTPIAVLTFEKPVLSFILSNNYQTYTDADANWYDNYYRAELMVSKGEFNAFVIFGSIDSTGSLTSDIGITDKDNIQFNGYNEVYFSSDDIKNKIVLDGVDENGRKLSSLRNTTDNYQFYFGDSSTIKIVGFQLKPGQLLATSNLPNNYSIDCGEYQADLSNEKKVRIVQFKKLNGIDNNETMSNNPTDFIKENLNITLSPFNDSLKLYFANTIWYKFYLHGFQSGGYSAAFISNITLDTNTWNGALYMIPNQDTSFGYSTNILANPMMTSNNIYYDFLTPMFNIREDSIAMYDFDFSLTPDILFYPNNGNMIIGKGSVVPGMFFDFTYIDNSTGRFNLISPSFAGQLGEERLGDDYASKYTIYDAQNNIVKSDSIKNFTPLTLNLGVYRFELTNKNFLVDNNTIGTAVYSSSFDLRKSDINSPIIHSLQIRDSKNFATNKLQQNEAGKLFFSVNDVGPAGLKSVDIYIKNYFSHDWQRAAIQNVGSYKNFIKMYMVDLSPFTRQNNTAMDLKIDAVDNSDNSTEYSLEPAYVIGEFAGNFVGPYKTTQPISSYELFNNYPNPFNSSTVLQYSLPEDANVQVDIYNIIGQHIEQLYEGEQKKGLYKLTWNAGRYASGVYIYRFTARGKTYFEKIGKMILLK